MIDITKDEGSMFIIGSAFGWVCAWCVLFFLDKLKDDCNKDCGQGRRCKCGEKHD